jgi:hypothetical protein
MSKSSKLSRVGFVLIPMGLLLMALGVGLSLVLTNQFGEAIEDAQESSLPGVEQAVGTGKTMTVWASTGYLSCEVTDAQDQQVEVSTTSFIVSAKANESARFPVAYFKSDANDAYDVSCNDGGNDIEGRTFAVLDVPVLQIWLATTLLYAGLGGGPGLILIGVGLWGTARHRRRRAV